MVLSITKVIFFFRNISNIFLKNKTKSGESNWVKSNFDFARTAVLVQVCLKETFFIFDLRHKN
jgi:hypothetical protein